MALHDRQAVEGVMRLVKFHRPSVLSSAGRQLCLTALLCVGLAACDRDEVRTYTVDKANSPAPATQTMPVPAAGDGTEAAAAAQPASMGWTVPAGWKTVPGQRPMRVATFEVGEGQDRAEIVVSQFPGDVGGVLANVNRWRKQVELEPINEADLPRELTPFTSTGLQGHLMRLRGPKQHMLAALIHEAAADRTWFVKSTVSPTRADTLEADLYAFAKSFGQSAKPATTQP